MKILVVDDNDIVLRVTETMLKTAGHEVVTVADGAEALRVCNEHPEMFDLVISDVCMPNMSGRELAECIRKTSKPIPVILMSGFDSNSPSVIEMVKDGKLDDSLFLQKPFTNRTLLNAVKAAAEKREAGS